LIENGDNILANQLVNNQQHESVLPVLKTILYWNSFFGKKDFTFGFGQQPFVNAKCPTATCYATDDRSLFNESDVVIFSIQGMNLTDLPTYRFPHQRFVFFEMEPPATTDYRPLLHNHTRFGFFNWTMTYRLDSDIVNRDSYGVVLSFRNSTLTSSKPQPRQGITAALPYQKDELVNISSKKKLVAWFVSHCVTPNRREDYVRELSKYIPVDIYGKCGNLTCSNRKHCKEMIRRDYKFYIAFENSLCTDYVTEKLAIALIYDAVPVSRLSVTFLKESCCNRL
jgi:alpha-1,3-fucosyltransferase